MKKKRKRKKVCYKYKVGDMIKEIVPYPFKFWPRDIGIHITQVRPKKSCHVCQKLYHRTTYAVNKINTKLNKPNLNIQYSTRLQS